MIVAGIGCRRGVPAEELEKVVHMALDRFELQAARLDAIATEAGKAAEPAFAELSRRLSTRLEACTIEELDRQLASNEQGYTTEEVLEHLRKLK